MKYTYLDQNRAAISEGFAGLHLKRSSTTVAASTKGPSNINDHVIDLRAEIEHMTTAISNPWLKAGLQMGMDKAVQDLVSSLRTNTIPRRSTEPTTQTCAGDLQNDIENGFTTSMPPLLRKLSRRRYLQGTYSSIPKTFFWEGCFIL
jgi:hypothetical protein